MGEADGRGQTPGAAKNPLGGAPGLGMAEEEPKGERRDGLLMLLLALLWEPPPCAASTIPTRNTNHFWTQASGSPVGGWMLPVFPISLRSSPSLPVGDPSQARWLQEPQPRAGGDFVSAAAPLEPQGLDSGVFGMTPPLARVSWLSIPLGINPAPAKREEGDKGWG